ncbi:BLOC-1-related complex subunit 7 [Holothuria leucospilota]|uniref:BLOC-1-related complex subunit 7 n=1 Tax=Holothuria leucospilota TaxID=206669 RepID=A0A9Q1BFV6_HOLLE|nr:BLOC-1-related complex subunit 7 [Holothuria leucospilota]
MSVNVVKCLLSQAIRNFASQEQHLENSYQNMKKLRELKSHLEFQEEAIERRVEEMDSLQDQLTTLQR